MAATLGSTEHPACPRCKAPFDAEAELPGGDEEALVTCRACSHIFVLVGECCGEHEECEHPMRYRTRERKTSDGRADFETVSERGGP